MKGARLTARRRKGLAHSLGGRGARLTARRQKEIDSTKGCGWMTWSERRESKSLLVH
ncbi:hypothetical protein Csa_008434, partial [Cucumis sativus]